MTSTFLKSAFIVLLIATGANAFAQFPHAAIGSSYYDKPRGNVQSYVWRVYKVSKEGKTLSRIYRFEYDKKGCLVKETRTDAKLGKEDTSTKYIDLYTYDKQNKIAQVTYIKPHGVLQFKDTYRYSTLTQLTDVQSETSAGVLRSESVQLKMDNSGKLLAKYSYWTGYDHGPMRLSGTIYFKYDEKGRRIEEKNVTELPAVSGTTNPYVTNRTFIKYNQNGDRSQILDSLGNGKVAIHNYTYDVFDKHQNWLVQNHKAGDEVTALVEREITYYK